MVTIIARELLVDIRSMFRGWRLAFSLAFLGYILIIILSDAIEGMGFMVMMYCIWGTILMKSKVSRVYYLLPTGRKDRIHYLIFKSLGVFVYHIIIYILVILVFTLYQPSYFNRGISLMISYVIPALFSYNAINMGNYYYWEKCKDSSIAKKCKHKYVASMMISVMLMLYAYIPLAFHPLEYHKGIWLVVATLLTYFFALLCLLLQLWILRHTEISEENVRKVKKISDY